MKTAEKIKTGTYLEERIVNVKPVESSGKWATLLVQGDTKKGEPYMYNKVKKSYQVPLNNERKGGGIKSILDNYKRILVIKYKDKYPEGMTEREFFEEELGVNLNPMLPKEENFWRTDKRGRVTLTKKGMTLDLRQPMDMLRYKILLSNTLLISPSYDDRMRKATYEFMIVDEGLVTSRELEAAELETKAHVKYAEITQTEAKMIGFIKSLGRTVPMNYTKNWLKKEVLNVMKNDAANFLNIVEDPQYDSKIMVQEACEAGAITRKSNRRYVLDTGVELGDLVDTIRFLEDPENQEVKMRIKAKIDLYNKDRVN